MGSFGYCRSVSSVRLALSPVCAIQELSSVLETRTANGDVQMSPHGTCRFYRVLCAGSSPPTLPGWHVLSLTHTHTRAPDVLAVRATGERLRTGSEPAPQTVPQAPAQGRLLRWPRHLAIPESRVPPLPLLREGAPVAPTSCFTDATSCLLSA